MYLLQPKSLEVLNKYYFNQKVVFFVYNLAHLNNLQLIASYIKNI